MADARETDPTKIEVKYQGVPDWIEMKDEGTRTELIYSDAYLGEETPAWDLEEER